MDIKSQTFSGPALKALVRAFWQIGWGGGWILDRLSNEDLIFNISNWKLCVFCCAFLDKSVLRKLQYWTTTTKTSGWIAAFGKVSWPIYLLYRFLIFRPVQQVCWWTLLNWPLQINHEKELLIYICEACSQ